MSKAKERPVLVTTEFKGVFFGYLSGSPEDGQPVQLARARNCIYWSSDVRGFMGLAVAGPSKNCKVGPAVSSIELRKVTAIVEVSEEAAKKWEDAPWA